MRHIRAGKDLMIGQKIKTVRRLLSGPYHAMVDALHLFGFWWERKLRRFFRGTAGVPLKGTFCILCVKRPAYVRLALQNVNSLHFLDHGYRVTIMTDEICGRELARLRKGFDYPSMVEVLEEFKNDNEPWQNQKVRCLLEAARRGWVLVDADTIWHELPRINPENVTFLTKAYLFGENADEKDFLVSNGMAEACTWPHYVTGFVSLPPAFCSTELGDLCLSWTRKIFEDPKLRRLSEEIGLNLAIQSLVPRNRIATLKETDGPNDRNIMESLYYGCRNEIIE
jgi:hypothetical protein